jgi:hypothetical protein
MRRPSRKMPTVRTVRLTLLELEHRESPTTWKYQQIYLGGDYDPYLYGDVYSNYDAA